jgi:hypothetical protein
MSKRKNLTQPADWWLEFERAARGRNISLSEFAGDSMRAMLPASRSRKLSERAGVGAPRKAKG